MSEIVDTRLGSFRRVLLEDDPVQGRQDAWLWQCPCGEWWQLSVAQWNGLAPVAHDGCSHRYFETHEFGNELVAAIRASIFLGVKPTREDDQPSRRRAMAHNRLHAFGQNIHAPGILAALDEFVLTLAMRHQEKIYTIESGLRWKTGPECAKDIRTTWAQIRGKLEQDLTT